MTRVLLIHWNAEEAERRAASLRELGYSAEPFSDQGDAALKKLRDHSPDAYVIDLNRVPSRGRAVGVALRQYKKTRSIPIVFVQGDPEKTERVREQLPDAVFSDWSRIRQNLKQALENPPADPAVPGTMDAYAGASLSRKLGVRSGGRVMLLHSPRGFRKTLGDLPKKASVVAGRADKADVILLFVRSKADLSRRFPGAARKLADKGKLWIVWPKQSSDAAGDLTLNHVRAFGLSAGFVDYKISAVDATWSGLCFARRQG